LGVDRSIGDQLHGILRVFSDLFARKNPSFRGWLIAVSRETQKMDSPPRVKPAHAISPHCLQVPIGTPLTQAAPRAVEAQENAAH
jgi:hypothetical protein